MSLLLLLSLKEFDPVKYCVLKFVRNGGRDFGGSNGGGEVVGLLKAVITLSKFRVYIIYLTNLKRLQ